MTDHADKMEREETITDLDVPEGEAEAVTGGVFKNVKLSPALDLTVTKRIDKSSPL